MHPLYDPARCNVTAQVMSGRLGCTKFALSVLRRTRPTLQRKSDTCLIIETIPEEHRIGTLC